MFSLRIDREPRVPDSSNHSLYLIKLFNSSSPDGHCGGNQLLGGSVCFSPFLPNISNDLHVSMATPPGSLQTLPFSGCVHHLSSPDTLVLLKPLSRSRNFLNIHIHLHIRIRSHINNICIYICVIVNRQGHHNIRNGNVWVQTSHSTCTCTATLCVIEL